MGSLQKIIAAKIAEAAYNRKANKKKLVLSVVSLVLALAILVTSSYCWYSIITSTADTGDIQLKTGKGLRSNDLGEEMRKISKNVKVRPASSVDGRNIFFPVDGTDFKSKTAEMTYRSANVGDKNFDYIQLDITLQADADYTTIYIDDDETFLRVKSSDDDPNITTTPAQAKQYSRALRSALWYEGVNNGTNKPIVFTSQNTSTTDTAIEQINRSTGAYSKLGTQVAVPFKDFSYGKRQIATLNAGDELKLKYIVWLEGDSQYCTNSLEEQQIALGLSLTTSWDNLATIYFVDQTRGNATGSNPSPGYLTTTINNVNNKLYLIYQDKAHNVEKMSFTMYRCLNSSNEPIDGKWYCKIPDIARQKITFKVVESNNQNSYLYEFSKNNSDVSTENRGDANTYIAVNTSGTTGYGYWYDGQIEEQGIGTDIGGLGDDDDW